MDRRIVILGFMGCGKTTVAKELARKLEAEFIDLDSFITEHEGRSPAEIIQAEGETAFRHLESAALNEVLTASDARVIALGGGTWTVPANRTLIALHDCLSVWLDATFDLCWQRIIDSGGSSRPLAPDQETARARFADRRATYNLAAEAIRVQATDSPEVIVEKFIKLIGPTPTGPPSEI
jgi:shikimate kinase